jgi:glutamate-1-semialdehyde 2,1-aminomutase
LLIFDEVMTGFRVGPGGAQDIYGVRPDLTCLGKIAGGGMPLAAYGGRRDVMDLVAPAGPMYQAGTLSGNPVAVAAGIATLTRLKAEGAAGYGKLEATTREICDGIVEVGRKAGVSICGNRVGAMATVFFAAGPVDDVAATRRSDTRRFARFHGAMLEEGVYLPPSQFEAWFVSLAHGPQEVTATLDAARRAFSCLD